MKNSAVSVKNLSKDFRIHKKTPGLKGSLSSLFYREYTTLHAVQGIDLNISKGELVGFIGPNGAGKTTTLKMLSGLLYPSSGDIAILGFTPYKREPDFLKQISLVMGQKQQLYWDLPAIETFQLNREIYQIDKKKYHKVLDELVEILQVQELIYQPVRKMSLGQRMKCELIAALLHSPQVLYLDEPTIGLDVVMQKNMREFIKKYNKEQESTIILTSHYMGDVQELCERVVIIDHGKIGYDGKLTDLVKKYATHKNITLIFDTTVSKPRLQSYGKILHWEPYRVTFEIPRNQVKTVASTLLSELPVDDVDIAETPIEAIIARVFESGTS